MTHFAIGTVMHEKLGQLRIYFNGPNQEITFEKYSHENGRQCGRSGIIPKSLLNALESFENVIATGNYSKRYSNIILYEFDREELRAAEERIAKLRTDSKRRVMYVGAPTVSNLINILQQFISEDTSIAEFPIYFGGAEWYLHIDNQGRCVILDEENLYEDL